MIWVTTAHTIQNAWKSGLILCDSDEYGEPQYIGTHLQFEKFKKLEDRHDRI